MKRIFIILCLITICNITYADIASTGYVDSVVDSLSAVAKSGSYNDLSNKPTIPTVPTKISSFTNDSGYITSSYHDSTKQDKLPNAPANNGKYRLVYNTNTGQLGWEFEQFSLTCGLGQYDIGFSQCVSVTTGGTSYGYINHDGSGENQSDHGLNENGTWGVTFTAGVMKGIASCNTTAGTQVPSVSDAEFSQDATGKYCWCKMTSPATSSWGLFNSQQYSSMDACKSGCAKSCGGLFYGTASAPGANFRYAMYSSIKK